MTAHLPGKLEPLVLAGLASSGERIDWLWYILAPEYLRRNVALTRDLKWASSGLMDDW